MVVLHKALDPSYSVLSSEGTEKIQTWSRIRVTDFAFTRERVKNEYPSLDLTILY
jgi:hypothetical protein